MMETSPFLCDILHTMDALAIIFYVVILLFSVIIHEMAHGYAADALGDPTPRLQGRLTLNPLVHLDLVGSIIVPLVLVVAQAEFILGWAKPVVFNVYNLRNRKWGPALIAVAGPVSNIALAVVFGLLIRLGPTLGIVAEPFYFIASAIVFLNILLAVFNMIPVPPLDGHHILFALIPEKFNHIKRALYTYSIFFVLIVIFVAWRFIRPLVMWLYTLITGNVFMM